MNDIEVDVGHPVDGEAELPRVASNFIRPALAIELDFDYAPNRSGHIRVPTCFVDAFARAYMHEVLHFWQVLSLGFITQVALEEWRASRQFLATGQAPAPTDLFASFMKRPSDASFSPRDLSEALSRFWDVHIYGPRRVTAERNGDQIRLESESEQRGYTGSEFDAAMGGKDDWSKPYQWMWTQMPSQAAVLLFPIVGSCALQSTQPVEVFLSAIPRCVPLVDGRVGSIHENWRSVFERVRGQVDEVCRERTGRQLIAGWQLLSRPQFKGTLWGHFETLMAIGVAQGGMRGGYRGEGARRFAFTFPGDPEAREYLTTLVVPPLTIFRDGGRWQQTGAIHKVLQIQEAMSSGSARSATLSSEQLAAQASSLRAAYHGVLKQWSDRQWGG